MLFDFVYFISGAFVTGVDFCLVVPRTRFL